MAAHIYWRLKQHFNAPVSGDQGYLYVAPYIGRIWFDKHGDEHSDNITSSFEYTASSDSTGSYNHTTTLKVFFYSYDPAIVNGIDYNTGQPRTYAWAQGFPTIPNEYTDVEISTSNTTYSRSFSIDIKSTSLLGNVSSSVNYTDNNSSSHTLTNGSDSGTDNISGERTAKNTSRLFGFTPYISMLYVESTDFNSASPISGIYTCTGTKQVNLSTGSLNLYTFNTNYSPTTIVL